MTAIVVQVSISSEGGVPNYAVDEGMLTTNGIVEDGWRYPFHGGPKRAILLITSEGLDELVTQGFPVYPGAVGENLTTLGIDRRSLRLGQRFQVGAAVIELTQARLPCDTLSVYGTKIQAAMYDARVQKGDVASPVWGLSGFYASVVVPGILRSGDTITLLG